MYDLILTRFQQVINIKKIISRNTLHLSINIIFATTLTIQLTRMISNYISRKNRTRKYELFLKVFKPTAENSILDVGFNNEEHSPVDNFLERNYPHSQNITALGVDADNLFKQRYSMVKTVIYEGNQYPFRDKQFDIGWSNAVIEHVGNENSQLLFLLEISRTCQRIYLTTPNRYFPIELHTRIPFLHWLPKNLFDYIIGFTPKKWAKGDYMHLLSIKQIKNLLKDAGITDYTIHRNKLFGFTMDFSIIINQ